MQIDNTVIQTTSSFFTPMAMLFLQDTITTMFPWLCAMFCCVLCDLVAGVRKSYALGIDVSWTMAARETMGKAVVYFAFVMMVATIEVASSHKLGVAYYGCLVVSLLECGSVISNILKPHGIEISLKSILKTVFMRLFRLNKDEAETLQKEERIEKIVAQEKARWEARKKHLKKKL